MKKMLVIMLALSLALVGVAQADIEISGHVVTVWSDAQVEDNNQYVAPTNGVPTIGLFSERALALTMGSGTRTGANNPLSNGLNAGQAGAAARGADRLAVAEIELDVEADITDNISTRIDIEADEQGNFDIEAAYIKLVQPFDVPFDVIVGKFVAPIGVEPQEQIDRKLITQSLPDRVIPNTLTGIAVTGTVSAIDYVVFYVNDMAAGDNDRNAVTEGSNAYGARLATSPLEGLDIGVTYAVESLDDQRSNPGLTPAGAKINTEPNNQDYTVIDLDAVYANGPWEIRGEYLAANEDDTVIYPNSLVESDGDLDAWSVQVAYDVDEQINVVARYASSDPARDLSGFDRLGQAVLGNMSSVAYDVISVGASYAFSENAIFKLEYSNIQSDDVANPNIIGASTQVFDPDDDLIAAELTVAF